MSLPLLVYESTPTSTSSLPQLAVRQKEAPASASSSTSSAASTNASRQTSTTVATQLLNDNSVRREADAALFLQQSQSALASPTPSTPPTAPKSINSTSNATNNVTNATASASAAATNAISTSTSTSGTGVTAPSSSPSSEAPLFRGLHGFVHDLTVDAVKALPLWHQASSGIAEQSEELRNRLEVGQQDHVQMAQKVERAIREARRNYEQDALLANEETSQPHNENKSTKAGAAPSLSATLDTLGFRSVVQLGMVTLHSLLRLDPSILPPFLSVVRTSLLELSPSALAFAGKKRRKNATQATRLTRELRPFFRFVESLIETLPAEPVDASKRVAEARLEPRKELESPFAHLFAAAALGSQSALGASSSSSSSSQFHGGSSFLGLRKSSTQPSSNPATAAPSAALTPSQLRKACIELRMLWAIVRGNLLELLQFAQYLLEHDCTTSGDGSKLTATSIEYDASFLHASIGSYRLTLEEQQLEQVEDAFDRQLSEQVAQQFFESRTAALNQARRNANRDVRQRRNFCANRAQNIENANDDTAVSTADDDIDEADEELPSSAAAAAAAPAAAASASISWSLTADSTSSTSTSTSTATTTSSTSTSTIIAPATKAGTASAPTEKKQKKPVKESEMVGLEFLNSFFEGAEVMAQLDLKESEALQEARRTAVRPSGTDNDKKDSAPGRRQPQRFQPLPHKMLREFNLDYASIKQHANCATTTSSNAASSTSSSATRLSFSLPTPQLLLFLFAHLDRLSSRLLDAVQHGGDTSLLNQGLSHRNHIDSIVYCDHEDAIQIMLYFIETFLPIYKNDTQLSIPSQDKYAYLSILLSSLRLLGRHLYLLQLASVTSNANKSSSSSSSTTTTTFSSELNARIQALLWKLLKISPSQTQPSKGDAAHEQYIGDLQVLQLNVRTTVEGVLNHCYQFLHSSAAPHATAVTAASAPLASPQSSHSPSSQSLAVITSSNQVNKLTLVADIVRMWQEEENEKRAAAAEALPAASSALSLSRSSSLASTSLPSIFPRFLSSLLSSASPAFLQSINSLIEQLLPLELCLGSVQKQFVDRLVWQKKVSSMSTSSVEREKAKQKKESALQTLRRGYIPLGRSGPSELHKKTSSTSASFSTSSSSSSSSLLLDTSNINIDFQPASFLIVDASTDLSTSGTANAHAAILLNQSVALVKRVRDKQGEAQQILHTLFLLLDSFVKKSKGLRRGLSQPVTQRQASIDASKENDSSFQQRLVFLQQQQQSFDLFNRLSNPFSNSTSDASTATTADKTASSQSSSSASSKHSLQESSVLWYNHPTQANGSCTEIAPHQWKVTSIEKFAHYFATDIVITEPGNWYYVVKIENSAIHQIGWAAPKYSIRSYANVSPYGIGDDDLSWSLDQSRPVIYHGFEKPSIKYPSDGSTWSSGDYIGLGVSIDADKKATFRFWQNGKDLGVAFKNVNVNEGFMPAVSVRAPESSWILLLSHAKDFGNCPLPAGYRPISTYRAASRLSALQAASANANTNAGGNDASNLSGLNIKLKPLHHELLVPLNSKNAAAASNSTIPSAAVASTTAGSTSNTISTAASPAISLTVPLEQTELWLPSLIDFFMNFQLLLVDRVERFVRRQSKLESEGKLTVKKSNENSSTSSSSSSASSVPSSTATSDNGLESFEIHSTLSVLSQYCSQLFSRIIVSTGAGSSSSTQHIFFLPSSDPNALPQLSPYSFVLLHSLLYPLLQSLQYLSLRLPSSLLSSLYLGVLPGLQRVFETLENAWFEVCAKSNEALVANPATKIGANPAHASSTWLISVLLPFVNHLICHFARNLVENTPLPSHKESKEGSKSAANEEKEREEKSNADMTTTASSRPVGVVTFGASTISMPSDAAVPAATTSAAAAPSADATATTTTGATATTAQAKAAALAASEQDIDRRVSEWTDQTLLLQAGLSAATLMQRPEVLAIKNSLLSQAQSGKDSQLSHRGLSEFRKQFASILPWADTTSPVHTLDDKQLLSAVFNSDPILDWLSSFLTLPPPPHNPTTPGTPSKSGGGGLPTYIRYPPLPKLQKSVEVPAYRAVKQLFACLIRHTHRVDLIQAEIQRREVRERKREELKQRYGSTSEIPPAQLSSLNNERAHPKLIALYYRSTELLTEFKNARGRGEDCELLAKRIEARARFLCFEISVAQPIVHSPSRRFPSSSPATPAFNPASMNVLLGTPSNHAFHSNLHSPNALSPVSQNISPIPPLSVGSPAVALTTKKLTVAPGPASSPDDSDEEDSKVPAPLTLQRSQSRWIKAKAWIRLLRHTLGAVGRLKKLILSRQKLLAENEIEQPSAQAAQSLSSAEFKSLDPHAQIAYAALAFLLAKVDAADTPKESTQSSDSDGATAPATIPAEAPAKPTASFLDRIRSRMIEQYVQSLWRTVGLFFLQQQMQLLIFTPATSASTPKSISLLTDGEERSKDDCARSNLTKVNFTMLRDVLVELSPLLKSAGSSAQVAGAAAAALTSSASPASKNGGSGGEKDLAEIEEQIITKRCTRGDSSLVSSTELSPSFIPTLSSQFSNLIHASLSSLEQLSPTHPQYEKLWLLLLQAVNYTPSRVSKIDATLDSQVEAQFEALVLSYSTTGTSLMDSANITGSGSEWETWHRVNQKVEQWIPPTSLTETLHSRFAPVLGSSSSVESSNVTPYQTPTSLNIRLAAWTFFRLVSYQSAQQFVEWHAQQTKSWASKRARAIALRRTPPPKALPALSTFSERELHPAAKVLRDTLLFIRAQLMQTASQRAVLFSQIEKATKDLTEQSIATTAAASAAAATTPTLLSDLPTSVPKDEIPSGFATCRSCLYARNTFDASRCSACGSSSLEKVALPKSAWIITAPPKQQKALAEIVHSVPTFEPSARVVGRRADGKIGCTHYPRFAKIRGPCCNTFYCCRHCHNEVAGHTINRRLISEMVCMNCVAMNEAMTAPGQPTPTPRVQPISNQCVDCLTQMAGYYCHICRVFDGDMSHDNYHCDKCEENGVLGLCRRGRYGAFHCDACNLCQVEGHACPKGGAPTSIEQTKRAEAKAKADAEAALLSGEGTKSSNVAAVAAAQKQQQEHEEEDAGVEYEDELIEEEATVKEEKEEEKKQPESKENEEKEKEKEKDISVKPQYSSLDHVLNALIIMPNSLVRGVYAGHLQHGDIMYALHLKFTSVGPVREMKQAVLGQLRTTAGVRPLDEAKFLDVDYCVTLAPHYFEGTFTPGSGTLTISTNGSSDGTNPIKREIHGRLQPFSEALNMQSIEGTWNEFPNVEEGGPFQLTLDMNQVDLNPAEPASVAASSLTAEKASSAASGPSSSSSSSSSSTTTATEAKKNTRRVPRMWKRLHMQTESFLHGVDLGDAVTGYYALQSKLGSDSVSNSPFLLLNPLQLATLPALNRLRFYTAQFHELTLYLNQLLWVLLRILKTDPHAISSSFFTSAPLSASASGSSHSNAFNAPSSQLNMDTKSWMETIRHLFQEQLDADQKKAHAQADLKQPKNSPRDGEFENPISWITQTLCLRLLRLLFPLVPPARVLQLPVFIDNCLSIIGQDALRPLETSFHEMQPSVAAINAASAALPPAPLIPVAPLTSPSGRAKKPVPIPPPRTLTPLEGFKAFHSFFLNQHQSVVEECVSLLRTLVVDANAQVVDPTPLASTSGEGETEEDETLLLQQQQREMLATANTSPYARHWKVAVFARMLTHISDAPSALSVFTHSLSQMAPAERWTETYIQQLAPLSPSMPALFGSVVILGGAHSTIRQGSRVLVQLDAATLKAEQEKKKKASATPEVAGKKDEPSSNTQQLQQPQMAIVLALSFTVPPNAPAPPVNNNGTQAPIELQRIATVQLESDGSCHQVPIDSLIASNDVPLPLLVSANAVGLDAVAEADPNSAPSIAAQAFELNNAFIDSFARVLTQQVPLVIQAHPQASLLFLGLHRRMMQALPQFLLHKRCIQYFMGAVSHDSIASGTASPDQDGLDAAAGAKHIAAASLAVVAPPKQLLAVLNPPSSSPVMPNAPPPPQVRPLRQHWEQYLSALDRWKPTILPKVPETPVVAKTAAQLADDAASHGVQSSLYGPELPSIDAEGTTSEAKDPTTPSSSTEEKKPEKKSSEKSDKDKPASAPSSSSSSSSDNVYDTPASPQTYKELMSGMVTAASNNNPFSPVQARAPLSLIMYPSGVSGNLTVLEPGRKWMLNSSRSFATYYFDNLKLKSGSWYYVVQVLSNSYHQLGWATTGCVLTEGVGDDLNSWSYDGGRRCTFHAAKKSYGTNYTWEPRTYIGLGITIAKDGKTATMRCWFNGNDLGEAFNDITVGEGIFPMVSAYNNLNGIIVLTHPKDFGSCPLPKGYKPFFLPELKPTKTLSAYPSQAYKFRVDQLLESKKEEKKSTNKKDQAGNSSTSSSSSSSSDDDVEIGSIFDTDFSPKPKVEEIEPECELTDETALVKNVPNLVDESGEANVSLYDSYSMFSTSIPFISEVEQRIENEIAPADFQIDEFDTVSKVPLDPIRRGVTVAYSVIARAHPTSTNDCDIEVATFETETATVTLFRSSDLSRMRIDSNENGMRVSTHINVPQNALKLAVFKGMLPETSILKTTPQKPIAQPKPRVFHEVLNADQHLLYDPDVDEEAAKQHATSEAPTSEAPTSVAEVTADAVTVAEIESAPQPLSQPAAVVPLPTPPVPSAPTIEATEPQPPVPPTPTIVPIAPPLVSPSPIDFTLTNAKNKARPQTFVQAVVHDVYVVLRATVQGAPESIVVYVNNVEVGRTISCFLKYAKDAKAVKFKLRMPPASRQSALSSSASATVPDSSFGVWTQALAEDELQVLNQSGLDHVWADYQVQRLQSIEIDSFDFESTASLRSADKARGLRWEKHRPANATDTKGDKSDSSTLTDEELHDIQSLQKDLILGIDVLRPASKEINVIVATKAISAAVEEVPEALTLQLEIPLFSKMRNDAPSASMESSFPAVIVAADHQRSEKKDRTHLSLEYHSDGHLNVKYVEDSSNVASAKIEAKDLASSASDSSAVHQFNIVVKRLASKKQITLYLSGKQVAEFQSQNDNALLQDSTTVTLSEAVVDALAQAKSIQQTIRSSASASDIGIAAWRSSLTVEQISQVKKFGLKALSQELPVPASSESIDEVSSASSQPGLAITSNASLLLTPSSVNQKSKTFTLIMDVKLRHLPGTTPAQINDASASPSPPSPPPAVSISSASSAARELRDRLTERIQVLEREFVALKSKAASHDDLRKKYVEAAKELDEVEKELAAYSTDASSASFAPTLTRMNSARTRRDALMSEQLKSFKLQTNSISLHLAEVEAVLEQANKALVSSMTAFVDALAVNTSALQQNNEARQERMSMTEYDEACNAKQGLLKKREELYNSFQSASIPIEFDIVQSLINDAKTEAEKCDKQLANESVIEPSPTPSPPAVTDATVRTETLLVEKSHYVLFDARPSAKASSASSDATRPRVLLCHDGTIQIGEGAKVDRSSKKLKTGDDTHRIALVKTGNNASNSSFSVYVDGEVFVTQREANISLVNGWNFDSTGIQLLKVENFVEKPKDIPVTAQRAVSEPTPTPTASTSEPEGLTVVDGVKMVPSVIYANVLIQSLHEGEVLTSHALVSGAIVTKKVYVFWDEFPGEKNGALFWNEEIESKKRRKLPAQYLTIKSISGVFLGRTGSGASVFKNPTLSDLKPEVLMTLESKNLIRNLHLQCLSKEQRTKWVDGIKQLFEKKKKKEVKAGPLVPYEPFVDDAASSSASAATSSSAASSPTASAATPTAIAASSPVATAPSEEFVLAEPNSTVVMVVDAIYAMEEVRAGENLQLFSPMVHLENLSIAAHHSQESLQRAAKAVLSMKAPHRALDSSKSAPVLPLIASLPPQAPLNDTVVFDPMPANNPLRHIIGQKYKSPAHAHPLEYRSTSRYSASCNICRDHITANLPMYDCAEDKWDCHVECFRLSDPAFANPHQHQVGNKYSVVPTTIASSSSSSNAHNADHKVEFVAVDAATSTVFECIVCKKPHSNQKGFVYRCRTCAANKWIASPYCLKLADSAAGVAVTIDAVLAHDAKMSLHRVAASFRPSFNIAHVTRYLVAHKSIYDQLAEVHAKSARAQVIASLHPQFQRKKVIDSMGALLEQEVTASTMDASKLAGKAAAEEKESDKNTQSDQSSDESMEGMEKVATELWQNLYHLVDPASTSAPSPTLSKSLSAPFNSNFLSSFLARPSPLTALAWYNVDKNANTADAASKGRDDEMANPATGLTFTQTQLLKGLDPTPYDWATQEANQPQLPQSNASKISLSSSVPNSLLVPAYLQLRRSTERALISSYARDVIVHALTVWNAPEPCQDDAKKNEELKEEDEEEEDEEKKAEDDDAPPALAPVLSRQGSAHRSMLVLHSRVPPSFPFASFGLSFLPRLMRVLDAPVDASSSTKNLPLLGDSSCLAASASAHGTSDSAQMQQTIRGIVKSEVRALDARFRTDASHLLDKEYSAANYPHHQSTSSVPLAPPVKFDSSIGATERMLEVMRQSAPICSQLSKEVNALILRALFRVSNSDDAAKANKSEPSESNALSSASLRFVLFVLLAFLEQLQSFEGMVARAQRSMKKGSTRYNEEEVKKLQASVSAIATLLFAPTFLSAFFQLIVLQPSQAIRLTFLRLATKFLASPFIPLTPNMFELIVQGMKCFDQYMDTIPSAVLQPSLNPTTKPTVSPLQKAWVDLYQVAVKRIKAQQIDQQQTQLQATTASTSTIAAPKSVDASLEVRQGVYSKPLRDLFMLLHVLRMLHPSSASSIVNAAPNTSNDLFGDFVDRVKNSEIETSLLSMEDNTVQGVSWHLERLRKLPSRSETASTDAAAVSLVSSAISADASSSLAASSSPSSSSAVASSSSTETSATTSTKTQVDTAANLSKIYHELAGYINYAYVKATGRAEVEQTQVFRNINTFLRSLLCDPTVRVINNSVWTPLLKAISTAATGAATSAVNHVTVSKGIKTFKHVAMKSLNDADLNRWPLLSELSIHEFVAHALVLWNINNCLRDAMQADLLDFSAAPANILQRLSSSSSVSPFEQTSSLPSIYGSLHASASLALVLHSHQLFFSAFKYALLNFTCHKTRADSQTNLSIDSFKALQVEANSMSIVNIRRSIFGQWFQQAYSHGHVRHRASVNNRPYTVQSVGLFSYDAGGPAREMMDRACKELQSNLLPFFVPVANAKAGIGTNRDCWVPRPYFVCASPYMNTSSASSGGSSSASSGPSSSSIAQEKVYQVRKQCYRFIGQIIGLALRSKQLLPLNFPPIVWKSILQTNGERDITLKNVEEIDLLTINLITAMRKHAQPKLKGTAATTVASDSSSSSSSSSSLSSEPTVSPSTFLFDSVMREMTFEVIAADGRSHPLIPNGKSVGLSSTNWHEYQRLLEEFRLHEFDNECREIRIGLTSVVPPAYLQLLSWQELKYAVVGTGSVDVVFLEKMTTVEGPLRNSATMRYFWNVLKNKFNEEQRAQFLTFVWGRSTLPTREGDFERRFSIKPLAANDPNNQYPVAHTCFFTLDLPAYTNEDVLFEKLLFAIENCVEIDGDQQHVSSVHRGEEQHDEDAEEFAFR